MTRRNARSRATIIADDRVERLGLVGARPERSERFGSAELGAGLVGMSTIDARVARREPVGVGSRTKDPRRRCCHWRRARTGSRRGRPAIRRPAWPGVDRVRAGRRPRQGSMCRVRERRCAAGGSAPLGPRSGRSPASGSPADGAHTTTSSAPLVRGSRRRRSRRSGSVEPSNDRRNACRRCTAGWKPPPPAQSVPHRASPDAPSVPPMLARSVRVRRREAVLEPPRAGGGRLLDVLVSPTRSSTVPAHRHRAPR